MKYKVKHPILLSIILFLFIYSPPILRVNILHILTVISYLIIFIRYRKTFLRFITNTNVFIGINGILLSFILLTIILSLTTKDYLQLYSIAIIVLEVFPISLLIAITLKRGNYELFDFFNLLLNIALIQSIFAIIMFFNPEIKNFILNNYYQSYLINDTMTFWSQYRLNGISQGLMFAMPVVQGFMAVIAFLLYIKRNVIYVLYIPFLLFSAMINARTGLLVFFVGVLIIFILNFKWSKYKMFFKIILFILILVTLASPLMIFISSQSNYVADWIIESVNETILFLQGDNTGYYDAAGSMFFLPEINELFVGTGQTFLEKKYINSGSDIGYVNDLFLGGIIFVILYYSSFITLLISGRIRGNWMHQTIIFLMVITMFMVNIKGFAFHQNDFVNLFILISVVLLYYKINNETSPNEIKGKISSNANYHKIFLK